MKRFEAAFKAYDIRGEIGSQLTEERLEAIARAAVESVDAKTVVVGHDVRPDSPAFADALCRGANAQGADVIFIGQGGTEEVYFYNAHLGADLGMMVTASHNPITDNGIKLVKRGSAPISGDQGLPHIRDLAVANSFSDPQKAGSLKSHPDKSDYIKHLLSYIDSSAQKPLKIVTNAGNGPAGAIVDLLETHLPFEFIKIQHEPDPTFPNGIPNPLLEEKRAATADAVRAHGADFGVAWDGDFDRCFLFDSGGNFIESYYLIGLISQALLAANPGNAIIYEPRLMWNTEADVAASGGKAVLSRTGHAIIKASMREADAVYGGEMSGHHYFRDFFYCDSGMIPWLLIADLIAKSGRSLTDLVAERQAAFPCSGELNFTVDDKDGAIAAVKEAFPGGVENQTDGLSLAFDDWRLNVRKSNTEPLLRLNVEARGSVALMETKRDEVVAVVKRFAG